MHFGEEDRAVKELIHSTYSKMLLAVAVAVDLVVYSKIFLGEVEQVTKVKAREVLI